MAPLRIVFMGTADLSCASLRALVNAPDLDVAGVVTQPDKPKGRDMKAQPPAVKVLALELNLPVLQPQRARNPEFIEQLRAWRPDLIAVAAYGQILPEAILTMPRLGCLNVHTSLLPKYRGAGPIQWAILNDDRETGVTIMKIGAGLDTGDIVTQETTPISPEDTAETLHDRLAQMGADLLVRTISDYAAGKVRPRPQAAEGVSYAPKITKEDGRLDWNLPARTLWNRVRGLAPWPGAFTFLPATPKPLMLKIWKAEVLEESGAASEVLRADKKGIVVGCGAHALRIMELQREGGRRMTAEQFLAGHPLEKGCKLSGGKAEG